MGRNNGETAAAGRAERRGGLKEGWSEGTNLDEELPLGHLQAESETPIRLT